MEATMFVSALEQSGISFYCGVPDSLLSPFTDELVRRYGATSSPHHIVAHNEGGSVGLAAGHHLATGKVGCVYLQNSGLGNAANPIISLTNEAVYAIPMLFIVGWRGEPGHPDEPQHVFQGEITEQLLGDLAITHTIVDNTTTTPDINNALGDFRSLFAQGKSAAFLIKKGAFTGKSQSYSNNFTLTRERALEILADVTSDDPIVSTTGKISRELFEIRERRRESHARDFLTVGSMGHALMISLGIANEHLDKQVWCADGDGAALMHLGGLGIVGAQKPTNLKHVVLNNAAHDTVGGMPTVADHIDLAAIAQGCGYTKTWCVDSEEALATALTEARDCPGPVLVEVRVALGSRENLGRPTTTPQDNKEAFMSHVGVSRPL